MSDPVNHPDHYLKAAITIEPIELTSRVNSCLGQAINYVMRRQHKHPEKEIEELEKAKFYFRKFQDDVLGEYQYRISPDTPVICCGASDNEIVIALATVFSMYPTEPLTVYVLRNLLTPIKNDADRAIDKITSEIDQRINYFKSRQQEGANQ